MSDPSELAVLLPRRSSLLPRPVWKRRMIILQGHLILIYRLGSNPSTVPPLHTISLDGYGSVEELGRPEDGTLHPAARMGRSRSVFAVLNGTSTHLPPQHILRLMPGVSSASSTSDASSVSSSSSMPPSKVREVQFGTHDPSHLAYWLTELNALLQPVYVPDECNILDRVLLRLDYAHYAKKPLPRIRSCTDTLPLRTPPSSLVPYSPNEPRPATADSPIKSPVDSCFSLATSGTASSGSGPPVLPITPPPSSQTSSPQPSAMHHGVGMAVNHLGLGEDVILTRSVSPIQQAVVRKREAQQMMLLRARQSMPSLRKEARRTDFPPLPTHRGFLTTDTVEEEETGKSSGERASRASPASPLPPLRTSRLNSLY